MNEHSPELEAAEPLADAPELAEALSSAAEPPATVDAPDEGTLDARAWDELDAAIEQDEAAPAAPDPGFDDDAPTLTNHAPAESEQTTSDADSNDDNRETSA